MMNNESFDSALKEIRVQAQKTVPEVSRYLTALGYKASEKTVYSWESGRSRPTIDIFLDMCKFYGVTDVFSYFGGEPLSKKDALSKTEQTHIKKYRLLDPIGKEAVDGVLNAEYRRYEASQARAAIKAQRADMEIAEDTIHFIVPWYFHPMSAGTGEEAGEEQPEPLRLIKEAPRGTSFAAPVRGDSMEPTYHNGDRLFVRAQEEIEPGQIGVFWMDGRQWVKELGDGVLLSHNPAYPPIPMRDDIKCQGLVLGVCDSGYFE